MACNFFLIPILLIPILLIPVSAQESHIIQLIPTDDTTIVVDYSDLSNPKNLQEKSGGDLEGIVSFYSWNFAPEKKIMVTPYLKFDLKDISSQDIISARLLLNAEKTVIVEHSPNVSIYSLNSTSWSEEDLKDGIGVSIDKKISNTIIIFQPDLYEWDITQYVIDNAGSQIAIGVMFSRIIDSAFEHIEFSSKESSLNNPPILEIETLSKEDYIKVFNDTTKTNQQKIDELEIKLDSLGNELITIKESQKFFNELNYTSKEKIKLTPIDDSFVVFDFHTPQEQNEIKDKNFGSEKFLRLINTWNGTGMNEKVISPAFLKFNLTGINLEKIQSAELKMYPFIVEAYNYTSLAVFQVTENNWSENQITASNSPPFDKKFIDSVNISDSHNWYSWNVTNNVITQTNSEISFGLTYPTLEKDHGENISFYSKESTGSKSPYLEIQYNEKINESGGCLIATATYGTELAPQVQQLRELRDNKLLQTESGTQFMSSFNQFYYSFSPYIADLERQNPLFKEIVNLAITPLILSLSILNYVDVDSEYEIISYGISLITLNLAMYFIAPIIIIYQLKNKIISKK